MHITLSSCLKCVCMRKPTRGEMLIENFKFASYLMLLSDMNFARFRASEIVLLTFMCHVTQVGQVLPTPGFTLRRVGRPTEVDDNNLNKLKCFVTFIGFNSTLNLFENINL